MHVNAKVGLAIALVITIIIVIALAILLTRGPTEQVIVSPIIQPSAYDLPYIPPPIPYGFTYDDFPSSGENDYSLTPEQQTQILGVHTLTMINFHQCQNKI
jgi:hypothetical protein